MENAFLQQQQKKRENTAAATFYPHIYSNQGLQKNKNLSTC